MFDLTNFGIWLNSGIFVAAAAAVWIAGVRITGYVDAISRKTGIGHAVVGMILLAGVTSLPEIGVTVTASIGGQPSLALNNLFGSIALQVAILALVDFQIGSRALTSVVPNPQVMLLGLLNIILLAFAAAGMIVGDVALFGVGLWSWACLFLYFGSVWLLSREEGRRPWLAARDGRVDKELEEKGDSDALQGSDLPLTSLSWRTAALGSLILVAGFQLSETGEAIAKQTGLGTSFVGFALLALSTSLPELSTALTAARHGFLTLAISDILGTNLINVGLVFAVDLSSPGIPVLNTADTFAILGAVLGILITALFVAGLAERRNTTLGRLGIDSIMVAVAYFGGLIMLYMMR